MMKAACRLSLLLVLVLAFSFTAQSDASAQDPCNCKGYAGPGGPCYPGPDSVPQRGVAGVAHRRFAAKVGRVTVPRQGS